MVENLYTTYGGNRLTSVRDNATLLTYEGATDFNGEPNKEYPLSYNDAGSLISDAGRKIAKIDYDYLNNPVRIQFTDGNVTKYIYSATGEKLRVIYQTAVPNIAVAIGDTKELAPSEIQCTDYNDYLLGGNLTLKNGHIDKYQFEEGYCQAEKNSSNANIDDFTFYYYDKDHLGNIRQVTKADGSQTGNVVQTINYYPFGMQFCDGTTCDIDQKHKYNGKEFDNMHGLNTYDYGARQYNPVTARWDRMDPLCEKYYSISPYAYCANNPMKFMDPDGMDPGDAFATLDEAALNFGRIYNYLSIMPLSGNKYGSEYTCTFYSYKEKDGKTRYSYYASGPQEEASSSHINDDKSQIPEGRKYTIVGSGHTHAGHNPNYDGNFFSDTDIDEDINSQKKVPSINSFYLATTNGTLKKHWYNKITKKWMFITFKGDKYQLPSDANDPSHGKYTYQSIENKYKKLSLHRQFLTSLYEYLEERLYK